MCGLLGLNSHLYNIQRLSVCGLLGLDSHLYNIQRLSVCGLLGLNSHLYNIQRLSVCGLLGLNSHLYNMVVNKTSAMWWTIPLHFPSRYLFLHGTEFICKISMWENVFLLDLIEMQYI